jgi:hypothetical protein
LNLSERKAASAWQERQFIKRFSRKEKKRFEWLGVDVPQPSNLLPVLGDAPL